MSSSISLIVRVHPRLARVNSPDLSEWDELRFLEGSRSHVFVLESSSLVSTYDLIDRVDAVVVYHSTVGIESVFWGTPSILLSDTSFDSINASVYRARSCQELFCHLTNLDNIIALPDTALPYGHFWATYGIPFKFYRPNGLFSGQFLGINISASCLTPWGKAVLVFFKFFRYLSSRLSRRQRPL